MAAMQAHARRVSYADLEPGLADKSEEAHSRLFADLSVRPAELVI
jgi:hypothetical protein